MKASLLFAIALSTAGLSQSAQSATGNVDVYGQITIGFATAYSITFTGTLGDGITGGEDSGFGYDLSGWYGKSYSLRFILNSDPVNASGSGISSSSQIPGDTYRWWTFDQMGLYQVSLEIDGGPVFAGVDLYKNEVITENDQWVPADLPTLPAGVEGDRAYDGLLLETGYLVGCQGGSCDWNNLGQIREELWIGVGHAWSDLNTIGGSLPDLLNGTPLFADADYKRMYIAAGLWSRDGAVHQTAFILDGSIESVAIAALAAPVPEPEMYAMLIAGLGMLGWRVRRRSRALPFA